jgi:hypothetical protein
VSMHITTGSRRLAGGLVVHGKEKVYGSIP